MRRTAAAIFFGILGFFVGVFLFCAMLVKGGVQPTGMNDNLSAFAGIAGVGFAALGVWLSTYITKSEK